MLPTLAFMLGMIIYAYKVNYKTNQITTEAFSERMYKYHMEGKFYDPIQGVYFPNGQYSELIPPDALIDPGAIAGELGLQLITQLGLSKLFDALNIDNSTYYGAFAQGFTYSIADSAVNTYVQDGSLQQMSAEDLENATWAGLASAAASHNTSGDGRTDNATSTFQGTDPTGSSLREFLGSGVQAGLIGFFNSHGDWGAAGASAVGGMLNSDSSKNWVSTGTDGLTDSNGTEILRGATKGAVQSSVSGIFGGNWDAKTVRNWCRIGHRSNRNFCRNLPLTGDDQKTPRCTARSMAFSSVVSGGDGTSTLVSAGMGALGSPANRRSTRRKRHIQIPRSLYHRRRSQDRYVQGNSLEAIGMGALSGAVGQGMGWAGNQVSTSLSNSFNSSSSGSNGTSVNGATTVLGTEQTSDDLASDDTFNISIDEILNGANEGVLNAETLESFEGLPPEGGSA
ncbi:MAG: hypothetical protein R2877_02890 [Bdellovibrionota bacterium]